MIEAWNRFWFASKPTSTLAIFRVMFGLLVLLWSLSLAPDVYRLFGPDGVLPAQPHVQNWYGVFALWNNDEAVLIAYVTLLIASVLLCVGCWTRVVAIVVWFLLMSFERRNPWVMNSGDVLILNLAFYLMLAPAGASLSVDRWRRHRDDFWSFPSRAVWPLRLIQIQLCLMYLVTVWDKVQGSTWNDGTAVSYALRLTDLTRFAVPPSIAHSVLASNLLGYGSLAIEFGLAVLVWNRKARPWILCLGILLHVSIDLTIEVGFFSFAIITAYVVWISPEWSAERLGRLHSRLGERRRQPSGGDRVADDRPVGAPMMVDPSG